MNRRAFCRYLGLSAVTLAVPKGLAAAGEAAGPPGRPNIVYVFPDQHRQCSWPGGGDPQVITPNLERMAREGAVFNHCISNYPLCSPYRASLLTGRYPQAETITANIGDVGKGLPTTEVTIADALKKAGYATGYVGKWHLYPGSHGGSRVPPGPDRHGFDWWRVCHSYRKRYSTKYYDDNGKEITLSGYAPTAQMDLVLDFIEKNKDRPFCIFLSWHPPHPPYREAPKQFAEMYSPDKIKLRPNVPPEQDNRTLREHHVQYFAHITALDAEMGRLRKKLADLGIADNTIVCYSSDHGNMLGSQGQQNKNKPWDESILVPFLTCWPAAIPKGRRLDALFSTVDVTPTLLGLAGLPVPPQMQGADLSSILKGGNAPGPDSAFIMSIHGPQGEAEDEDEGDDENEGRKGRKMDKKRRKDEGKPNWRGVRTRRYTFVKSGATRNLEPWLLYDNEKDPCQLHNLIADPACAPTRKELDAVLKGWLEKVGEA